MIKVLTYSGCWFGGILASVAGATAVAIIAVVGMSIVLAYVTAVKLELLDPINIHVDRYVGRRRRRR